VLPTFDLLIINFFCPICRNQMRLTTEEHPMLLAEPSHNTSAAREKMVELMFEKYNVPAVFLAKNAVLSSFATARQTSLVVDVGHESTVGKF
jgi:actin-like protein 6A